MYLIFSAKCILEYDVRLEQQMPLPTRVLPYKKKQTSARLFYGDGVICQMIVFKQIQKSLFGVTEDETLKS